MPPALANLYCSPNDVYDWVGADAAQLRLDDRNLASGQTVATTAAAAVGAISLSVSALQYGLLKGTVLVFSDAGMDVPVEVTLSAAAAALATSLSVDALATAVASGAQATDNGVNVWLAGLMTKACKFATATCKRYLCGRYNDSDLVRSWSVNQWATAIAARWLAKRRYQAAPSGIEEDYTSAMEELKAVKSGNLNVEDIATRTAAWPFMTNLTVDDGRIFRARVEPQISEPTPTQFSQLIDWNSVFQVQIW